MPAGLVGCVTGAYPVRKAGAYGVVGIRAFFHGDDERDDAVGWELVGQYAVFECVIGRWGQILGLRAAECRQPVAYGS